MKKRAESRAVLSFRERSGLEMEEEIIEFYEAFYRHSLSGSELNDILDGK